MLQWNNKYIIDSFAKYVILSHACVGMHVKGISKVANCQTVPRTVHRAITKCYSKQFCHSMFVTLLESRKKYFTLHLKH